MSNLTAKTYISAKWNGETLRYENIHAEPTSALDPTVTNRKR